MKMHWSCQKGNIMKNYKNLIFDLGDVLLSYRWRGMLMDQGLSAAEAEEIGHKMFDEPRKLWHQLDLGIRSTEDIIREFEEEFPEDGSIIRWVIEHNEYMHVARPRVWAMIHALKAAGFHIYLLSNYPYDFFHRHTEYADFMQDLDGMMVSYMLHLSKPDPEIYQALLLRYRLNPGECIFFDDRFENVDQARKLGIDAVQVYSQESLLDDLKSILAQGENFDWEQLPSVSKKAGSYPSESTWTSGSVREE